MRQSRWIPCASQQLAYQQVCRARHRAQRPCETAPTPVAWQRKRSEGHMNQPATPRRCTLHLLEIPISHRPHCRSDDDHTLLRILPQRRHGLLCPQTRQALPRRVRQTTSNVIHQDWVHGQARHGVGAEGAPMCTHADPSAVAKIPSPGVRSGFLDKRSVSKSPHTDRIAAAASNCDAGVAYLQGVHYVEVKWTIKAHSQQRSGLKSKNWPRTGRSDALHCQQAATLSKTSTCEVKKLAKSPVRVTKGGCTERTEQNCWLTQELPPAAVPTPGGVPEY